MKLKPGDRIDGFRVTGVDNLDEYKSSGIRLEHTATGLDMYHVHNDDSENFFAWIFKTPPPDDSGVPHIIEHAVLAGSTHYPVKDPFLSLMKGSVNTFLNAMTYPDKTIYPAASPVREDFFNLFAVYSDAVFNPLLRKEIFHQEGKRYIFEDEKLDVTGVVYNEMKGAFSSFETVVTDMSFRSLFPDSTYRHESGGVPHAIRDLNYTEFLDFYATYYHPSNCRLFCYGDIPTQDLVSFIEPYLSRYQERKNEAVIVPQPGWSEPRSFFALGPGGREADEKTTYTINWRLTPLTDPDVVLALEMLSEILLGNQGAPMYQSLFESPFGQDLSPACGIDTDLQDLVFSLGVRGAEQGQCDDFAEYVFSELKRFVREGLPVDVIGGALTRVEFRNREIRGGIPFGLRLMGKATRGWLHGLAPAATLGFSAHMERLKGRYAADPHFFEGLVSRYLIDNRHYSVITVESSPTFQAGQDADHQEWREKKTLALKNDEKQQIIEDIEDFERFQATVDSPDDLACIPALTLDDIPRRVRIIDTETSEMRGRPLFLHRGFTNGIIYSDLAFPLDELDIDEEMLLPFFGKVLSSAGVGSMTYDQVATRLSLVTGGFFSFIEVSNNLKLSRPSAYFFVRIKTVPEKHAEALAFLASIITESCIDDEKRIRDLVVEYRNELRSSLVSSGHSFAYLRAASRISPALLREERWRGVEQYVYVCRLVDALDESMAAIVSVFQSLKKKILVSDRLVMNITCEQDHLDTACSGLGILLDTLPSARTQPGHSRIPAVLEERTHEAFCIPSTVNFVAAVIPGANLDTLEYACESIIAHILKTDQLWELIRMQGGAYGAFASANGTESLFSFGSYRDPHIARTCKSFMSALGDFCLNVTDDDIEKAKISILGREFKPLVPGELSMIGLRRQLFGIDDELRQKKHDQIYAANRDDIIKRARHLLDLLKERAITVAIGNEQEIVKAAADIPAFVKSTVRLL